jgi:prepilin-type N-terminal cleavage/methylation domain-containing protein
MYKRGFALVELLVVVIIILLLTLAYFGYVGHNKSAGKQEKTTMGQAIDKGHSVECMNDLNQLRQALQMRYQEDEKYPATLDGLGVPTKCPVSGQPYTYDPQTGTVKCATAGHEKF